MVVINALFMMVSNKDLGYKHNSHNLIVAQTLMLTAKPMDYDSVPMDGFDFDKASG